jgi:hypothetical protein
LVEKTFDWHAQDDTGNIWYIGRGNPPLRRRGQVPLGSRPWEAGKDLQNTAGHCHAWDHHPRQPDHGDAYRQEIYTASPRTGPRSWARMRTWSGQRDDAYPPGEFDNCLVTKEWSGLDRGSDEQKYYC